MILLLGKWEGSGAPARSVSTRPVDLPDFLFTGNFGNLGQFTAGLPVISVNILCTNSANL